MSKEMDQLYVHYYSMERKIEAMQALFAEITEDLNYIGSLNKRSYRIMHNALRPNDD